MYLITPTLLNSFAYYFGYEAEASGEDEEYVSAEQKEAKARAEFLSTLRREQFEKSEAMLAGIAFEDRVRAYCNGAPDDSPVVQEIGDICKGGVWQQSVKRVLDGQYLLYGKLDVMKRDTIIDIKRTKSYELGKYQSSLQHRIYFYCTGLPNFRYLVSDERSWWSEDYFNHTGIEQEIRDAIRKLIGYLEHDPEAKAIFYDKWKALEVQAA